MGLGACALSHMVTGSVTWRPSTAHAAAAESPPGQSEKNLIRVRVKGER